MAKEILLNIMYTGTFLESENIGHEIINLLKDDNGNNYVYVLPYGTMSKIHNNKIKTILLVRRCNSKIFEILAKATDLQQITLLDKSYNDEEKIEQHRRQIEYIYKNKITYGGIKPNKFFEDNEGNDHAIYITFKANDVKKVARQIFITTDAKIPNCYFMEDISHFPSQSPKCYISDNKKGYDVLERIINDETNWESENNTPKVKAILKNKELLRHKTDNFIKIIKKDVDCKINLNTQ